MKLVSGNKCQGVKWNFDFKRFHINGWFDIAGSFIFARFRFNVITCHIVNHVTLCLLNKKITKKKNKLLVEQANQEQKWHKKFKKLVHSSVT